MATTPTRRETSRASSWRTWVASSRVGTRTRAAGRRGVAAVTRAATATPKTRVLPEPLGAHIGHDAVGYIRRIGRWFLWRAGPATGGEARYMAVADDGASVRPTYRLHQDGSGSGPGADGAVHERFRSWKESLRDS